MSPTDSDQRRLRRGAGFPVNVCRSASPMPTSASPLAPIAPVGQANHHKHQPDRHQRQGDHKRYVRSQEYQQFSGSRSQHHNAHEEERAVVRLLCASPCFLLQVHQYRQKAQRQDYGQTVLQKSKPTCESLLPRTIVYFNPLRVRQCGDCQRYPQISRHCRPSPCSRDASGKYDDWRIMRRKRLRREGTGLRADSCSMAAQPPATTTEVQRFHT